MAIVAALCLVVLLTLWAAEFLLPNYLTRFANRVTTDLGLAGEDAARRPLIPLDAIRSNEFAFTFHRLPGRDLVQVAGIVGPDEDGQFLTVEQADTSVQGRDLAPLLERLHSWFPEEQRGGIKQLVEIDGALFGLLGLERENCLYVALVDFERMEVADDYPCLDNSQGFLAFQNAGGGYVLRDGELLIALGVVSDVTWSNASAAAQDPSSPYGKILRYDVLAEQDGPRLENRRVYTTGHRNVQGMVELGGMVLAVEHGPMGGDEINLIIAGRNYGWPTYSAGSQYNQGDLASFAAEESGVTNPLFTFVPSIAPSDVTTCPSAVAKRYDTADCVIVSALRGQGIYIVLGDFKNSRVWSVERIEVSARLREVFIHDDALYLVPDHGQLIRTEIIALRCGTQSPCGRE